MAYTIKDGANGKLLQTEEAVYKVSQVTSAQVTTRPGVRMAGGAPAKYRVLIELEGGKLVSVKVESQDEGKRMVQELSELM